MELDTYTDDIHDCDIFFQNINLLGFDKDTTEHDYKIPIHKDMFSKTNQKGLAVLLYFVLTTMKEEFKGKYAMWWFPYTMAEMKEFKKITLEYFQILQDDGIVPQSTFLSKSVLETASGRRVWEMLRFLSDYALRYEIHKMKPTYPLPDYLMTLNEFKEEKAKILDSETSEPIAKKLPAVANINKSILNRNRVGALTNIQREVHKFKEVSKCQQTEKQGWVNTATKLNDLYNQTKENIAKHKKALKEIDLNPNSDIVSDALERSLAWIDRIPLMDTINETYEKVHDIKSQMEESNLKHNLQTLIESKDEAVKMNVLSEDTIFKDLLEVQKDELKSKILANPTENKKVISIDLLIDQANRQTSDVIHLLGQNKQGLSLDDLKESIKENINLHNQRLFEIQAYNEGLESQIAS